MISLKLDLKPEEQRAFVQRAKSLGMTPTAYARHVILDSLKREQNSEFHSLQRSIRAAVVAFAHGFGITQNAPEKMINDLTKALLDTFDKVKK